MTQYIPNDWPEAEGELPPSLEYLLGRFIEAIREFTTSLRKDPAQLTAWYNAFRSAIIAYIQASFMSGQQSDYMGVTERGYVYDYVKAQVDYLNNFRLVIQSADEWDAAWEPRAESYARGIVAPYWKGRTKVLPLPAMPGDGSTDCGQLCACLWDVRVVDEANNDYDCYWILNASRVVKTEHCQNCMVRSSAWTPLRIRGGELQLPETRGLPDTFKEAVDTALKHLAGQHDQMTHGRDYSGYPQDPTGRYTLVAAYDIRGRDEQGRPNPILESEKSTCEGCGRKHSIIYEIHDKDGGVIQCLGSTCAKNKLGWSIPKDSVEIFQYADDESKNLNAYLKKVNYPKFLSREDARGFLFRTPKNKYEKSVQEALWRKYNIFTSTDQNRLKSILANKIYDMQEGITE